MSEFVEKAVGSLSNILSSVNILSTGENRMGKKLFFNFDKRTFINKLRSVESKKEEEEVIIVFLTFIQKQLSQPNVSASELEDYVQISLICELLNYPAPFIYVHAIKLAQKGTLRQKRTGYLSAAVLLHPHHELVILLINTIQKDLVSSNYIEVLLALQAVCNFINSDTVYDVFSLVEEKLRHENPSVRKLAIRTLDHCLRIINSINAYQSILPKLEKALSDSDLSVAGAAVTTLYNVVKETGECEYLVDSLLQLQNQLLQGHVSPEMEYQTIAAPWLQIKILKFISLLCKSTKVPPKVNEILRMTLLKAEVNHNIAYAIVYEVIEAVINIDSNYEMLQLAVSSAGKLLRSENANLKYMGIQALASIVKKQKLSVSSLQEPILECLNHVDETLQIKTLEALYYLANPSNAQAVCKKIVDFLSIKEDHCMQKELALKAIKIANQYNANNEWYIDIISSILLKAGNLIPADSISEIISIIEKDNSGALKNTVKSYYSKLKSDEKLPPCMIKIIIMVLSEPSEFEKILTLLAEETDEEASVWVLVCLRNVILMSRLFPENIYISIKNLKFESYFLKQLHMELLSLHDSLNEIPSIKFTDQVDPTLSFLDECVSESLESGCPCYQPPRLRVMCHSQMSYIDTISNQNISADDNELSFSQDLEELSSLKSPSYGQMSSPSLSVQSFSQISDVSQDATAVAKNIWSKEGRYKGKENSSSEKQSVETKMEKDSRSSDMKSLFAGIL